MWRMNLVSQPKIKVCTLFFISRDINPHSFSREIVPLNSQGCAKNADFFLIILNSLSLLGECAEG
jgi:hypothetical protein